MLHGTHCMEGHILAGMALVECAMLPRAVTGLVDKAWLDMYCLGQSHHRMQAIEFWKPDDLQTMCHETPLPHLSATL